MRVLITGGSGYLGSLLSTHLVKKGMQVVVYDRLLYGGEGLLALLNDSTFQLIHGDIRDWDTVRRALNNVDAVVHLAALVGEEACLVDPAATVAINVEATRQLVKIASDTGVRRMIFASTCSNYGFVDSHTKTDEDCPLKPLSLYAQTKVDAERIVVDYADKSLSTCILRIATICGLSPRMRFDLLVNDMARRAALGQEMSIFAPSAWRPFLHIRDAVDAIYRCLTAPSAAIANQIFNVVGENYQKRQLVELMKKHFPSSFMKIKRTKGDHRDYRVSAERIAKRLNFTPNQTIEDAFMEVANAVKQGIFVDPSRPTYKNVLKKKQLGKKRWRSP